jgi:hypothetical protein
MGADNIDMFIPHPSAIINVKDFEYVLDCYEIALYLILQLWHIYPLYLKKAKRTGRISLPARWERRAVQQTSRVEETSLFQGLPQTSEKSRNRCPLHSVPETAWERIQAQKPPEHITTRTQYQQLMTKLISIVTTTSPSTKLLLLNFLFYQSVSLPSCILYLTTERRTKIIIQYLFCCNCYHIVPAQHKDLLYKNINNDECVFA